MAIYPTKSHNLNTKNKKINTGIIITCVFSILLILLSFNLLQIFTKLVLGVFGLVIYPISIFFIVLGIMLICNKSIRTSKSNIICLIFWFIIFTMILHLASSISLIDANFGSYISSTFKSSNTVGGIIFSILVYPIYFLTYDVATYIILSIILVILTAIIIDKVYREFKNFKVLKANNLEEIKNNFYDEDNEISSNEKSDIGISNNLEDDLLDESTENDEEDLFIADEEETINTAKQKLGLGNNSRMYSNDNDYISKLDSMQSVIEEKPIEQPILSSKKPTIFVHDDIDSVNQISNITLDPEEENKKKQKEINDKKRKEVLDYLRITSGKFETKNKEKGIDNVKPLNKVQNNSDNLNLQQQKTENENRLFVDNSSMQYQNPFKSNDFFDNSLNKDNYKDKIQINEQQRIDDIKNLANNLPRKAQEVYNGNVKENIVDATGYRPVQIPMEPINKPKNTQQKIYKKPPKYNRPPLDLLKKFSNNIDDDSDYIIEKGNLIVETLKAFRIETKIINAVKGPTFTRYELQMAPGIPVNSVNNRVNDLSMALESQCRLQVPIPGKNAFGVEVPNKKRVTVGLRDILESSNFQNSKSPLTFALGKDIAADCKVACVDKLVHTLVAGSTGSGKSVCLNTMLISLLYKASPEDLKLILVDPKTVEFSMFNNLPHMLIPNTITDCEKAVNALSWLVEEMDNRYRKLSALGVKKISEYNETQEVLSGSIPKMFYIVMIFDEVGDFMTRAKKEIEEKIMLLAAKSRACGIHLILATQRPTVDVITGTIKANLPSRIAFAVNSYNDSKTILESSGAEYLLGMGDMLFLPQGSNDADRIQGCFISNEEVKSVINYIIDNNEADFDEEIENKMFNKNDGFNPSNGADEGFDPLLKDCLKFFIKTKRASASSLQANFGIGYPKANKIVMQMEKAGFISPGDSNGRRTLYTTPQEFEERFGENIDE